MLRILVTASMTLTGVERDSASSSSIDHNVTRVLNLTLVYSGPSMHALPHLRL